MLMVRIGCFDWSSRPRNNPRHRIADPPQRLASRTTTILCFGLISSTAVSARTLAVTMLIFGFSCLGWNFCFKRRLYAFDILALDGDDLRKLPPAQD
jgi:hypothetical protein